MAELSLERRKGGPPARFKVDGTSVKVVDAKSMDLKPSSYIRVDATFGKNFAFNYMKDTNP